MGSSTRDFRVEAEFLGQTVLVERIGCDGDLRRFSGMFTELDGKADALGIGGADLYVWASGRRYMFRDVARAVAGARTTPVLDGSGLKNSIERETVRWLQRQGLVDFPRARTLLVSTVDRFGLGEELSAMGGPVLFGDVMFCLHIPIPIRRLKTLQITARLLLPVITQMPFRWLYPTGSSQERIEPRFTRHYQWADVIAGDFHYIKRHMPDRLEGKTILTNTIRESDVALLRERGARRLITSTPEISGRSPGTNVFEALIVALSGGRPDELSQDDYMAHVRQMGWQPRVVELQ
ncbi:MAG TPA: quinate 5-dehydrogenase [Armatimonadota bacterium]|nr:quinate 5-dehydrogenase [Armatimonadota bacterium]HQK91890.1 quinate 5-dehydrogenase [Armatimonadota bacterium]